MNPNLSDLNKKTPSTQTNDENEITKRSILVGGLTKDAPLDKVIHAFQRLEVTGGGEIQNFDLYEQNKLRITYLNPKDAERVLSKGSILIIDNLILQISKCTNIIPSSSAQKPIVNIKNDEAGSSNSSMRTAIYITSREETPESIVAASNTTKESKQHAAINPKLLDKRRIILTNVQAFLNQEFLDLYVEFLSNEIEIERFDLSQELKNAIVVTFVKDIDFEQVRRKHESKPNLMNVKTDVYPVLIPDTVLVELDEAKSSKKPKLSFSKLFNKELLELYFSNKKRSAGEHVKKIKLNETHALVTFTDSKVASRVADQKKHQINKTDIKCRLYYEKIGPNPFKSENLYTNKKNYSIDTLNTDPKKTSPTKDTAKFETKFDPKLLTNQQTGYLLELQSIYNELNNSNLTLFTTAPELKKEAAQQPAITAPDLDSANTSNSKYLTEFNVDSFKEDKSLEYKPSLSFLSNDTELEHIGDKCQFKDCAFETLASEEPDQSDRKKDLELKPVVNLPSLDDPMLSFEEYSYLNNLADSLKNKNLTYYGDLSEQQQQQSESAKKKAYINSSEFNPFYKRALDQFNVTQKEISQPNEEESVYAHKALRNINFASRRTPRVIFKSRDRPPAPKLVRLNNSKRADPEMSTTSIQVPGSISSLQSGSVPVADQTLAKLVERSTASSVQPRSVFLGPPPLPKIIPKKRELQDLNNTIAGISIKSLILDEDKENYAGNRRKTSYNSTNGVRHTIKTPRSINILSPHPYLDRSSIHSTKFTINQQYGRHTLADSLNKLDSSCIEFLKQTKYLGYIRLLYPNLSVNLNENLKHLYFFGDEAQVQEAKEKVRKDLDDFKLVEFKLEHKELADFIQKPDIKKKIYKFISSHLAKYDANKDNQKANFKIHFCSYHVKTKSSKDSVSSNSSKKENQKSNDHVLVVYTNVAEFAKILYKYILDDIKVNYKIDLTGMEKLVESIRNKDEHWAKFYDAKYNSLIDYSLERSTIRPSNGKSVLNSLGNNKKRQDKWTLKLTGFREEIDMFGIELKHRNNKKI